MNNTQNKKIAQVTDDTLIVGVDIGSENHWARAILARGYEVSKKPFSFDIFAYLRMIFSFAKHIGVKSKNDPGKRPRVKTGESFNGVRHQYPHSHRAYILSKYMPDLIY